MDPSIDVYLNNIENKKDNNLFVMLFSVGIFLEAIFMGIAVYFFIRMKKKRKVLDEEISKIISIEERAEYRTKR